MERHRVIDTETQRDKGRETEGVSASMFAFNVIHEDLIPSPASLVFP